MSCIVVVPAYKVHPNQYECTSFAACCRVLGSNHTICMAAPLQICMDTYKNIASTYNTKLKIQYFDADFFKNIHGYNKLLLSSQFYSSFDEYEYILIYQLDAYVFRDELNAWCARGFDYIGAPLFSPGFYKTLQHTMIGNGGFSLRKTEVFKNLLHSKLKYKQLWRIKRPSNPYINWRKKIVYTCMLWSLGRCKKLFYFLSFFAVEDRFFSCALQSTPFELSIPIVQEAMFFAFDQGGAFWYEQTQHQLPFGVHAWHYELPYNSFYYQFIPLWHE